MTGVSDFSIRTTEVGVGVRLQSCIASEPQNHAAMLDGLHEIFMLLLVRADVEMTKRIVCIDFNGGDRKSTRLNSSHQIISYAVFCLKKKKNAPINSIKYCQQFLYAWHSLH